MFRILLAAVAAFLITVQPVFAADVGIVLMHGKWGTAKPKSPVGKLAKKLEAAGFMVELPSVAWSRERYLDQDFEAAMNDIDAAVARLKAKGARRVFVGGHSMGANAALGYGARRDGIAGILALAPGHIPDVPAYQDRLGHEYKKARDAVAAGQGAETGDYTDINQGEEKTVHVRADVYASWFDPDGPAVMPQSAAALKPGTALLWLVGSNDTMADRGEDYAFAKAPDNAHNAYVLLNGANHGNAPIKGAGDIVRWLKGF